MSADLPALPSGVDRVADLGTLLSIGETAKRLGVATKTVRRLIDRGELLGAHKVPMPSGKGEQWQIPVSAIEQHTTKMQATVKPDETRLENERLTAEVAELKQRLEVQTVLKEQATSQLEALHITVRLALQAPSPAAKQRWWRK